MYKKIILILACSYLYVDSLQASQQKKDSKTFEEQMHSFNVTATNFVVRLTDNLFVVRLADNLTEEETSESYKNTRENLKQAMMFAKQANKKLDDLLHKD